MKKFKSLLMALSFLVAMTAAFAFTTSKTPCDGTDRKHYTGTFSNPNDDEEVDANMEEAEENYGCDGSSITCTYYFDGEDWVACPGEPRGVYLDPPTK